MQAISVAVNQPKILPPMMITGVMSAGTATTRASEGARARSRADRSGSRAPWHRHDGAHLGEADQEARDDAGEEQRADRDREHAAPDDHQDRGRDDDREHRGDRGDGDRELSS